MNTTAFGLLLDDAAEAMSSPIRGQAGRSGLPMLMLPQGATSPALPIATPYLREAEFEQALEVAHQEMMRHACPSATSVIISGFSRYANSVKSLAPTEQNKIRKIAGLITRSSRLGCPFFLTVQLTGHADFDPLREQRQPGFMHKISVQRALAVKKALIRLINNTAISARVAWSVLGAAATRLAVPNPRSEQERKLNRRVEVSFRPINPVCMKQVLGTSITLKRPIGLDNRNAIRRFQQRHGLSITGTLTPPTVAALISRCGVSPATFIFHTVIADDGKGPSGGWQETGCETVRFKSPTFSILPPTVIDVKVRVGVPIRNQRQGVIKPDRVQIESVEAANLAGMEVTAALNAGEIIPSQVERMFIALMNVHLLIDGRRVTTCTGGSK